MMGNEAAVNDGLDERIRAIAREEVASLAGLVLRRLQETRAATRGWGSDTMLEEIFGEVLRDFGSTKAEPGA